MDFHDWCSYGGIYTETVSESSLLLQLITITVTPFMLVVINTIILWLNNKSGINTCFTYLISQLSSWKHKKTRVVLK
jgi:hypothetical protein